MLVKKSKILLIAYACEPNKGSEPGVGWNILLELSKYFEITLITRSNNIHLIEQETSSKKIKLLPVDLPKKILFVKKIIGIQLYYLLWQLIAIIKVYKNKSQYDITYLVTFGNLFYLNLFPFSLNLLFGALWALDLMPLTNIGAITHYVGRLMNSLDLYLKYLTN